MKEAQAFAKQYQKEMGWSIEDGDYEKNRASLLNNYMLLTTEVAEIAEELRKAFNLTYNYVQSGMDEGRGVPLGSGNRKRRHRQRNGRLPRLHHEICEFL
nr:hypothetical protein [Planococcus glaciei]